MKGLTNIVHFITKSSTKQSNTTKQNTAIEIQPRDQIEILLKEYELCTNDANHLEDSIWTATSILLAATNRSPVCTLILYGVHPPIGYIHPILVLFNNTLKFIYV